MSDVSSSGAVGAGSPKKPISPARNVIGIVLLIAVVAWCWFEYSAINRYNAAVTAIDARLGDESKALPPIQEAEALLGKPADGPGTEYKEGYQTFMQKTYTWRGLIKSHTLTAYYTNQKEPCLHHIETEGAKHQPPPVATGLPSGLPKAPAAVATTNPEAAPKGVPAKGHGAAHPPEMPAKAASETPDKTKTEPAAKTKTEPPAKSTSEAPGKVPAKESVPDKAAQNPK
jgi:hypothetical protein